MVMTTKCMNNSTSYFGKALLPTIPRERTHRSYDWTNRVRRSRLGMAMSSEKWSGLRVINAVTYTGWLLKDDGAPESLVKSRQHMGWRLRCDGISLEDGTNNGYTGMYRAAEVVTGFTSFTPPDQAQQGSIDTKHHGQEALSLPRY